MEIQSRHLVIGAFQPFGGKQANQAEEVAKRLSDIRTRGELAVPDDVDVTFVPLQTNAQCVEQFVQSAADMHADKVMLLGESGLGLRVESVAHDRGKPLPLMAAAVTAMLPELRRPATLATAAPAEAMARAGNATVSRDAGNFYCNYSYHCALRAGLNTVFVHVPAGIFGIGRDAAKAAQSVNQMLGEWYTSDGR